MHDPCGALCRRICAWARSRAAAPDSLSGRDSGLRSSSSMSRKILVGSSRRCRSRTCCSEAPSPGRGRPPSASAMERLLSIHRCPMTCCTTSTGNWSRWNDMVNVGEPDGQRAQAHGAVAWLIWSSNLGAARKGLIRGNASCPGGEMLSRSPVFSSTACAAQHARACLSQPSAAHTSLQGCRQVHPNFMLQGESYSSDRPVSWLTGPGRAQLQLRQARQLVRHRCGLHHGPEAANNRQGSSGRGHRQPG